MRHLQPVLWTKGLVLAPQHLQAQDRFFEERLGFQLSALHGWPWGFTRLALDAEALPGGSVSLLEAAGAFADGTVFDVPAADAAVPPRAIADQWGADEDALMVHLGLPNYRADGHNVGLSAQDEGTRYRAEIVEVRDEITGLSERPLQLARKNLRLLLAGEATEGYSTLPVARVIRDGEGDFRFDPDFIPPLLDVTASPALLRVARRLVELLVSRSAGLAALRRQRNVDVAQFSVSDIANFWLLYTLNLHLPVLRHLAESKHGHPVELFEEMLALAGTLTTFSSTVSPADFPPYNHLDLGASFNKLDAQLRELLETAVPENVIAIPLREVETSILAAALDEDRMLTASRVYLAVRAAPSRAELIRLVPQLVKVSSSDRIAQLVRQALAGAALTHVATPPGAVPVKLDYEYFELDRSGPEWPAVVQARNLAAYVPHELAEASLELVLLLRPR